MTENRVYQISDEIVAREMDGDLVIIPITADTSDLENSIFTLNESGREIWTLLDGQKDIESIVDYLVNEYDGDREQIRRDVQGFTDELAARKIIQSVD